MNKKHPPLTPTGQHISQIRVERIRESIVAIRTEYHKGKLLELADSLEESGQLQTIVVQEDKNDPGYYELIIGSRRLRGVRLRGKTTIAAYVIAGREPAEMLLIALAENLHRDDLNPFEEARAFLRLIKEHEVPPAEIADRINKPHAYVTNRLQLLSMPEEVIRMIAVKQLPISSLRSLSRLSSGGDQVRYARLMIKHGLSQTELSNQIRQDLNEPVASEHNRREFTSVKLLARLDSFDRFVQKVPRRIQVNRLNVSEKGKLRSALDGLERNLKNLRAQLELELSIMVARSPSVTSYAGSAANEGQEWTVTDMRRITSTDRPSDSILATELGRTVPAIRAMRTKASESKK
jgi:ParB family chromosome partitioning protein